jgi:uncharacterized protein (TIGR01777 family)
LNIFITGATGFIGGALCHRLMRDGHTLTAWVRDTKSARTQLERSIELVSTSDRSGLLDAMRRADAVVNLAGAPVVGKRWSKGYKDTLRTSRIGVTKRLVSAMNEVGDDAPRVFVSGSAVGFYGLNAAEVDEDSSAGDDFLAQLTVDWETAAADAAAIGCRVVLLRTGIVLGAEGGALQKMLPPFRLGAGGRIGSGRQGMAWIHHADIVEAIVFAIENDAVEGAINGTAPNPVSNAEFTKALASQLNRPALIPVPPLALKALFGEGAQPMLGGQFARPTRLEALGFEFAFRTVEDALRDILDNGDVEIGGATDTPKSQYLDKRGATYRLRTEVTLQQSLDDVFSFFSRAENLGILTPPHMSFDILTPPAGDTETGDVIDYRITLGPIPMNWQTEIASFVPGSHFVDVQLRGPYRSWLHEHRFIAGEDQGQTTMLDVVHYRPPLGILGRIVHWMFIRHELRRIFSYRRQVVRFRFGTT